MSRKKSALRRISFVLFWGSLASILVIGGITYWKYRQLFPTTNDAYVQANIINMAPQVSGPINAIYVKNNQFVKQSELLFTIDPRPYQDALNKALAGLKLAEQQMRGNIDAVEAAKAQVDQAKSQLIVDEKHYNRITKLVSEEQASIASGDEAQGRLDVSQANLTAAKSQLGQAEQQLGEIGDRNAQIQQAHADLEDAKLNLGYTAIRAPADGYITNFNMRVGSMITAAQPLFQIVETKHWWVDANYKETQLELLKVNQTAKIKVDMYPHHHFSGYIESISHGSGSAFSLLPPENATGNWVKVTQRFPVKIALIDPDPNFPLRVGSSSTVTTNTTETIKKKHIDDIP